MNLKKNIIFITLIFNFIQILSSESKDILNNLLVFAAQRGNFQNIKDFVEEGGADINSKDEQHYNILHIAADCGYVDIIEWLLSKENIDPNYPNIWGRNALTSAMHKLHCEMNYENLKLEIATKQQKPANFNNNEIKNYKKIIGILLKNKNIKKDEFYSLIIQWLKSNDNLKITLANQLLLEFANPQDPELVKLNDNSIMPSVWYILNSTRILTDLYNEIKNLDILIFVLETKDEKEKTEALNQYQNQTKEFIEKLYDECEKCTNEKTELSRLKYIRHFFTLKYLNGFNVLRTRFEGYFALNHLISHQPGIRNGLDKGKIYPDEKEIWKSQF